MKNDTKKTDRRVIRTKKAIRTAFAELIAEKEYNDITVTDIAERADINRKTFYNYYKNTEDLLTDIESEAVSEYDKLLDDMKANEVVSSPEMIVARISSLITEDLDYFRDLLTMSRNAALFSRISDNIMMQVHEILANQDYIDPLKAEVLAIYIASGTLAVYREWIKRGEHIPREALDAILTRLTIACTGEAVKSRL